MTGRRLDHRVVRFAADPRVFLGLAVMLLCIGLLDYATGPAVSMTLFYLVPVASGAWLLGRSAGIALALVAGAVSLVDVSYGPSSAAGVTWNALSRSCLLVVAAVAVHRIRSDRDRLLVQDAQRARSLRLLDLGLAEPARQLRELTDHWTGSDGQLAPLVHRHADDLLYLAREFASVVRLQSAPLPMHIEAFDFVQLVDELRGRDHRILMTAPGQLLVRGDRERTRQVLSALIAARSAEEEISFYVRRLDHQAELVVGSSSYRGAGPGGPSPHDDVLALAVELAQAFFRAQGGAVDLSRNPLTRRLRISARLPLSRVGVSAQSSL